jgi:TATA-box binding protein (TBP) (component of TFIID and TFIIIB)
MDIESEWNEFLLDDSYELRDEDVNSNEIKNMPKCSDLYISTTTKIAYLTKIVDLKNIFWKLPLIHYYDERNGIIKKQMKFNSSTQEEVDELEENLEKNKERYIENSILQQVSKENTITAFKDVRKISVGICKKDITSYRIKKKSAFYNCFVLILRIKQEDIFKELHVKIFNTGKLELPGIQTKEIFELVLTEVLNVLQPFFDEKLEYNKEKTETVLINSNFNCGFLINREELFKLLKYKYKIHATFDPCSYPGIQCKYRENNLNISFMIFRTGSVLIVGKCVEEDLYTVYNYLKEIFSTEFNNIYQSSSGENVEIPQKKKVKKTKKKLIKIKINK